MDEDFQGLDQGLEEYYSLEEVFRLTNPHNFIKLTPQELINFAAYLAKTSRQQYFPISSFYVRIEALLKQFCLYPEKIPHIKLIEKAIKLSEQTHSLRIKTRLLEIKVSFLEATKRINKAIEANKNLINHCLQHNLSLNKTQAVIKGNNLAQKAVSSEDQITEEDLEDFIASLDAGRITETDVLEFFADVITPPQANLRPTRKIHPTEYLYGDEEVNKINAQIKANNYAKPLSFIDKLKDFGKKTLNVFSSWIS